MRLGFFVLVALVSTLCWWAFAAEVLHTANAVVYFMVPAVGNLLLAWSLSVWRRSASIARTAAISSLSVGVVAVAFVIMVVVAVWNSDRPDSQESHLDNYQLVERDSAASSVLPR
jgi:uncharacterized membrane protein